MHFAIITLFAACAFQAQAAPLDLSSIGSELGSIVNACNLNRAKIIVDLAKTDLSIGKLDTSDPAVASAVQTAKTGLTQAQDAIETIAAALIGGGSPPGAARQQVLTSLQNAQTAIQGISNSTDVTDQLSDLTDTIDAGNGVVQSCN